MITRRGFLLSCLALGVAPVIVRASSIMRVRPVDDYGLIPYPQTIRIGLYDRLRALSRYARENQIKPAIVGGEEFYFAYVTPDYGKQLVEELRGLATLPARRSKLSTGEIVRFEDIIVRGIA